MSYQKPSLREWLLTNTQKGGSVGRDLLREEAKKNCSLPNGSRTLSNVLQELYPESDLLQQGNSASRCKAKRPAVYYGFSLCYRDILPDKVSSTLCSDIEDHTLSSRGESNDSDDEMRLKDLRIKELSDELRSAQCEIKEYKNELESANIEITTLHARIEALEAETQLNKKKEEEYIAKEENLTKRKNEWKRRFAYSLDERDFMLQKADIVNEQRSHDLPRVPTGFQNTKQKKLGKGSFGEVYKENLNGHDVAVKVFSKSFIGQQEARKEARALKRTQVTKITPELLGFGSLDDDPVIITSFHCYQGGVGTIQYLAKKGEAPELNTSDFWLGVFAATNDALATIHSQGIIHNDIKTDNVIIENAKTVKIIDLGLSRSVCDTKVSSVKNRDNYPWIAKEVATGEHPPSTHSDMYAFGYMMQKVMKYRPHVACAPLQMAVTECMQENRELRCGSFQLKCILNHR